MKVLATLCQEKETGVVIVGLKQEAGLEKISLSWEANEISHSCIFISMFKKFKFPPIAKSFLQMPKIPGKEFPSFPLLSSMAMRKRFFFKFGLHLQLNLRSSLKIYFVISHNCWPWIKEQLISIWTKILLGVWSCVLLQVVTKNGLFSLFFNSSPVFPSVVAAVLLHWHFEVERLQCMCTYIICNVIVGVTILNAKNIGTTPKG